MQKIDINEKIDIVVLWVDGNDEEWLKEKNKYLNIKGDSKVNRFRDCENLQYLFRGIEKYALWVNKIFFVTWGHIPKWLDTTNEKIVIIKHEDFIPKQYLPTFNSNVIELNLHRIDELSEKFIIFNDDFFILKSLTKQDFFVNGKPTAVYVEYPQLPSYYNDTYFFMNANIMAIINKHFNKKMFVKKNFNKIINLKYKDLNFKTLFSLKYKTDFLGFLNFHMPYPYLKQTFNIIWEKEYETLDLACRNKFRTSTDLGHYLCRYWQMLSGNFEPIKKENLYLKYLSDNSENIKQLKSGKYKFVCVNDVYTDIDFEKSKREINTVFEELFPKKSQFEI